MFSTDLVSHFTGLYNMMYPDCNIISAGDVSMDDLTLSGDIISDD